ncbi:MAG: alkaline phosphatase [Polyangiaceae bacterium]
MSVTRLCLGAFLVGALSGCSDSDSLPAAPQPRLPALPRPAGQELAPRYVIVVIGDGMQQAHEVAASRYLFGTDAGLSFHQLPVQAYVTTWDVSGYNVRASALGAPAYDPASFDPNIGYDIELGGNAPYPTLPDQPARRLFFLTEPHPDSASTGSAMSTGLKTDYNNIAWAAGDPSLGQLETSPATLRRRWGMSSGFVTTVPLSHATPATWFSHNVDRYNYISIGHEMLSVTRPDVMIGGGVGPEDGNYVSQSDVDTAVGSKRWSFVERKSGVDGADSLRAAAAHATATKQGLLGVFGGAAGNFESPIPSDTPGAPLVARASTENPLLADAALSAIDVLAQNPRGFFLMVEQGDVDWSNHANDYARMIGCMWDLHNAVQAIVDYVDQPNDSMDWSNTTLLVTADHANSYLRLEKQLGSGDLPAQINQNGVFSYPDGDVTYGTTQHTGELVTLHARGYAADRVLSYATQFPGLPIVDNTDIYRLTIDGAER